MKRILSILLILATLCLFLISCDNGNNTNTDTNYETTTDTSSDSNVIIDTGSDQISDSDVAVDTGSDENTDSNIESDASSDTDTDSESKTPDDNGVIIDTDSDEILDSDTDTEIPQPQAPSFTMIDYNGNEITLDSLKGKPIVLNFWASWCPPCRNEMPAFEQAYKEYGNDVQFIMVSHLAWGNDTVQSAKAFYEQSGYTFPIYFDNEFEAYSVYGLQSIPRTVFINADGTVSRYITGGISYTILSQEIEKIK